MSFIKNKNKIKKNKGFTLIELLITIVIFVLLTGIVLFSQNGFNNSLLLNNLAYDISLTVRQVQSYGVSVRESIKSESGSFPTYGLYFETETGDQRLGKDSFIIFTNPFGLTDSEGNLSVKEESWPFFGNGNDQSAGNISCAYEDPQCIQKYKLKNGAYISEICTGNSKNDCTPANMLYVFFKRPKPNAIIYSKFSSADSIGLNKNYARITISSSQGTKTNVVITGLGQIYVEK